MQHLWRTLRVAIAVAVSAVPIALADPHVAGFIDNTPIVSAYFPIVAGVVYALYRAYRTRGTPPPVTAVASNGAPTMGAT